jgi:hypothetical protein
MASPIRVIVHSGEHGLEEAVNYYATFPSEPSPAGDLDLAQAVVTPVKDATLDAVLDEMAKASNGSVVLIVCHAYQEGLLMPVAKGARLPAGRTAIEKLLDVSTAERRAKLIRAMPSGAAKELKAKIDAWIKLAGDMAAGTVAGEISLAEIENLYRDWLDEVAKNVFLLGGASPRAVLLQLVAKMERVQALKLDRVELRACDIGEYGDSMKKLKQLFGCNKLLAPDVGTFYLKGVPVDKPKVFDQRYIAEHRVGDFRPPGPLGSKINDPSDFILDVIKKNPSTRIFWDYVYGHIPAKNPHPAPYKYDFGIFTTKMKTVLAMLVEQVRPYYYRGSAATWHESATHGPEWADARMFVDDYIMHQSQYKQGRLNLAGFWTPKGSDPWLLPRDEEYLNHIKQV